MGKKKSITRKIRYTVDKKHYFLSVNFRKNSLGIKVNSLDMLEICYLKNFAVLRDISYQLKAIHKIEVNENKFGGKYFSKTLYFMAAEILIHMDGYVVGQGDARTALKSQKIYYEAMKYFKIDKSVEEYLKNIYKFISEHSEVADIGVNLLKDHDSAIINSVATPRVVATIIDNFMYKIGKKFLVKENPKDTYYHCYYKCKTVYKIGKDKKDYKI